MEYSLSKLTLATKCDEILALITEERDALALRRANVAAQITNNIGNSTEYAAEYTAVQAEVAALTTVVETLPEGASKDFNRLRLKRLEAKNEFLRQATAKTSPAAIVVWELDVEQLDSEINTIQALITQMQARKTELGG